MIEIPRAECPLGYPREQLEGLLGPYIKIFDQWMNGQTMCLCDGRSYNHTTKEYESTECADSPHGPVVYPWDVRGFFDGRPVDD